MDPVKGSDTYRAVTDHYACLAQWIKEMSPLLDRHEAISTVSVVLSCDAIEKDLKGVKALCSKLAYAQVPFCMAIEGNDLFEKHVNAKDLAGCSSIILSSPKYLNEEAKARIQRLTQNRPVWDYVNGLLPDGIYKPIQLVGTDQVWVLPRAVPGDPTAPVAIHLLNRDYDPKKQEMKRKNVFTIKINTKILGNRSFSTATLHQPRLLDKLPEKYTGISEELVFKQTNTEIEIIVPNLDLWGIIELK